MRKEMRGIVIVARRRPTPPPPTQVLLSQTIVQTKPKVTLWTQIKNSFLWMIIIFFGCIIFTLSTGIKSLWIVPVAGGIALGSWGHLLVHEIKQLFR